MDERSDIPFLNELRGQLQTAARTESERLNGTAGRLDAPVGRGRSWRRLALVIVAAAAIAFGGLMLTQGSLRAQVFDLLQFWGPPRMGVPRAAQKAYVVDCVVADPGGTLWASGKVGMGPTASPFATYWSGHGWTFLPTPSQQGTPLYGIRALAPLSPDDVWGITGGGEEGDSIIHWDGRRWTTTAYPDQAKAILSDIVAVAPGGVWAVGQRQSGTYLGSVRSSEKSAAYQPLALHWDGLAWRSVTVPRLPGQRSGLAAAVALPDGTVWAVGSLERVLRPRAEKNASRQDKRHESVALRWDGRRWERVPTPNPGRRGSWLVDVAAAGRDDAWAVGASDISRGPARQDQTPLIERWDGRSWTPVPWAPSLDSRDLLWSVAVIGARDVWIAGSHFGMPLAARWDGVGWDSSVSRSLRADIRRRVREEPAAGIGGQAMLAAAGPDDLWLNTASTLVPWSRTPAPGTGGPSIYRWDGRSWTWVELP